MKSLQLRQSRRGLMLMWRIRNKKNSLSSDGLTRISVVVVVVAGGATLMVVEDVEAEVAGTRMAVVEAADTRMAVAVAAGTTMNKDTTSQGTTTTTGAGVVALGAATLTTTTTVAAGRTVATGGLSWVRTPSSLTVFA
jgi:hypothetical protein